MVALRYYPFQGTWGYGTVLFSVLLIEMAFLLILKLSSALRSLSRRQSALAPLERWYFRLFRLRIWLLLYMVILPLWISPMIARRIKLWAAVLFVCTSVAAYLSVVAQWDNTLREKWRCSVLDRRNRRLLTRSLLVHLLFTILPAIGYLVLR